MRDMYVTVEISDRKKKKGEICVKYFTECLGLFAGVIESRGEKVKGGSSSLVVTSSSCKFLRFVCANFQKWFL